MRRQEEFGQGEPAGAKRSFEQPVTGSATLCGTHYSLPHLRAFQIGFEFCFILDGRRIWYRGALFRPPVHHSFTRAPVHWLIQTPVHPSAKEHGDHRNRTSDKEGFQGS
jgi:hypothetical protein